MKAINIKIYLILALCSMQGLYGATGDTLRLTFNKADSLFLKKSFALLAAQCNVNAVRAMRIQAKLYPNPSLYVEQSLVNKTTRPDYETDPTRTGSTETILQVQQLILLAGKRNKQIKLADINTRLAEADFENVLRTLRLQLHEDLSRLYYNNVSLYYLLEERESIEELSGNLELQVQKGYVSLNEVVRLKSLLLEIDKNINDYSAYNYSLVAEINTILGNDPRTLIKPEVKSVSGLDIQVMDINRFLDSATVYNPELKSYNYRVDLAKATYSLNKAQAVPDANVQFVYDKSGNYIRNYYGLGLGIQLPTWNRNQGYIKAGKYQISQSENELKQEQSSVASQMIASYYNYQLDQKLLSNYRNDYEKELLLLMDNVLENYKKRQLGLNEFVNYYESYKQSYLSLLDVRARSFSNIEQLNYLTGKVIITYE